MGSRGFRQSRRPCSEENECREIAPTRQAVCEHDAQFSQNFVVTDAQVDVSNLNLVGVGTRITLLTPLPTLRQLFPLERCD